MAFDWSQLGSPLQGIGSGLMAAGAGGWQQFAPAYARGALLGQQQLQYKDEKKIRDLQAQEMQAALEQQRTANQQAEAKKQAWAQYLNPGMMGNGVNNGRPGGMPQLQPGIMAGQFNPDQMAYLKTVGPDVGQQIIGNQLFKEPATQEPYSPLAKLQDDLLHGRIDKATYDAAVKKETYIAPPASTRVEVNTGSNGIDYGDPEPGLAWMRNPDGTVKLDDRGLPIAGPYQGGKPYIAAQGAAAADTAKTATAKQTADIITDNISRIKKEIQNSVLPTTGTLGPFVSKIGGTSANNVRAMVDTIKANVGFDKLQQMRNASPTGGALGAVSEQENAMLQASIANLEQSQTQDQFIYNLDKVNDTYNLIVNGPTGATPPDRGGSAPPPASNGIVQWERGPDGKARPKAKP